MKSRRPIAAGLFAIAVILACLMCVCRIAILVFVKGDNAQGEGVVEQFLRDHALFLLVVLCAGIFGAGIAMQDIIIGLRLYWAERQYDLKKLVKRADKVISGRLTLSETQLCGLATDLGSQINRAAEDHTLAPDMIAAYRRRVVTLFDMIEAGFVSKQKEPEIPPMGEAKAIGQTGELPIQPNDTDVPPGVVARVGSGSGRRKEVTSASSAERRRKAAQKLEDVLRCLLALPPIMAGILVLGYQVLLWLKEGHWHPYPLGWLVFQLLPVEFWNEFCGSWVGLQKIVFGILEGVPLSVALVVVGALILASDSS